MLNAISKLFPYVFFAALTIFILKCDDRNSNYDKAIRLQDSLEVVRLKLKDSLSKNILVREAEVAVLRQQNTGINNTLTILREDIKKDKVIPNDYVEYFNNRYSTLENKSVDGLPLLGYKTSYLVFSDLYNLDNLRQIDSLQNVTIKNKDLEITSLNLDKMDYITQLSSCESSLSAAQRVKKERKYSIGVSIGADTKLTTPLIKIDAGYKGWEAGYLKTNNTDYLMAGRRWSW